MPNTLKDDVQQEYVHGTDWWTRFIVIALIVLTVIFVREVLEIYREYQTEPAFVIGLVTAVVTGEFSIMYFIFRNKKDVIRETIRYEHDFEMRPATVEPTTFNNTHEHGHSLKADPDSFEGIFPKDDSIL